MITCFCPSSGPRSSLTICSEIISVITILHYLVSVDRTITVCTVNSTICSLFHCCFKNISLGIQQINATSLIRDRCGNYTSFIIFTNIFRVSSFYEIEPAFSLGGICTKPSIMKHLSRNPFTLRIEIVKVCFTISCDSNLTCSRFSVRIQAIIISVDFKISCFFCFFFKLFNCFQSTILVIILKLSSCPFPCALQLLAYIRRIWSNSLTLTASIGNSFLNSCKI